MNCDLIHVKSKTQKQLCEIYGTVVLEYHQCHFMTSDHINNENGNYS